MKKHLTLIFIVSLLIGLSTFVMGQARTSTNPYPFYQPADHVYQYMVKAGGRNVYLWIPPHCSKVKGALVSLSNLLERQWLEDSLIRHTAADIGLAIIWIGPANNGDKSFTADMKPGMEIIFQQMMDELADESGYAELKKAPVIAMGHSANGQFAWTFANAFPDRTIAVIPIKTIPPPDSLRFSNIPFCYIVGETTEWPQYRVPDPATKPGDRDFYWPIVHKAALALRSQNPDNLVGVVTDPGGGHFDWSPHLTQFVALYIRKACRYRLPDQGQSTLKPITKTSGWLTGNGGMDKDKYKYALAPYALFKGPVNEGYWFFDKETATAAVDFEGDRIKRKKQMPTFIQDGQLVPVAKLGYAVLKFEPDADGVSFHLQGGFLPQLPPELIGAGETLGHSSGAITFRVITGPAIQTGPNSFRLQFDRAGMGGELWIQETQVEDSEYRHAVQPGMIRIPAKLTAGKPQEIKFAKIPDLKKTTTSVSLQAVSNSGLPVSYYVVAGPAYVENNHLIITPVPVESKYPVKVTVVAYQWGRVTDELFQSAAPVEQTFNIYR
ncbi:hypothetical protein SAMN05216490_3211 [Mucilaginibacter mallensis]|uniref:Alpha/beta hydrolase family protein n=1 Tax=Mucilaginibacter mallensis TaxID=652787 RepID=A0A1H1ZRL5_MUCMA|nr:hypothetical protein [Mucilaginibacter mallensis]SDT36032.1 hypothetical protein SAMN05216490_3211 [Mucilaginibacter mallensis]